MFDVTDFDETFVGPWEWDVKRLAASVCIAGRDRDFKHTQITEAVLGTVAAYRGAMGAFARRGNRRVLAPEELARVLRDRGTNTQSSARNRMAGVIVGVKRDGVMAQIGRASCRERV